MPENRNLQGDSRDKDITIAEIYPESTSEEQANAEYRLLGYLKIVRNIFERVCRENPKILTDLERRATLRKRHIQKDR